MRSRNVARSPSPISHSRSRCSNERAPARTTPDSMRSERWSSTSMSQPAAANAAGNRVRLSLRASPVVDTKKQMLGIRRAYAKSIGPGVSAACGKLHRLMNMPDHRLRAEQVPLHQPIALSSVDKLALKADIKRLLTAQNAVIVAHYYVDGDIQDLRGENGGCVADSLEMARFGQRHAARTLVVARGRFRGETAKILS